MRASLLAIVRAWQEDWRATSETTKVVVVVLAAMVLGWAGFVIWVWTGFEF